MKQVKFYQTLISAISMAALIFIGVVKYSVTPQIPLIFGCFISGIVALWIGYSWEEILDGIVHGITQAIEAILILLLIGVLVGAWISAGTVPVMIYYGLQLISAKYFLFSTVLICSAVSLIIGAWGTVGTVGLAFMGIGVALGIPSPIVAGSIITGSYFGEIVSPLSDATNLTAAVTRCKVFFLMKKVLPISLFALVISEIIYYVIGLQYGKGGTGDILQSIAPILRGLESSFHITPLALLPMLIMIICIISKIPAIPSMLIGSIAGSFTAILLQGSKLGTLFNVCFSGYVSNTGVELMDTLLTAGGIESMMESVSIIIIAMGFGGLMQHTGQMEALVKPIVDRIKDHGGIIITTIFSCIGINIILPDQYLGISVPGQMFLDEYDRRHISRFELSRALLCGGAVTSPLIPWNTCGIYCAGLLGISSTQYLSYAYLCLLLPIMLIAVSFGDIILNLAQFSKAKHVSQK